MAFKDFPRQAQAIRLLQRSLERGRLGHAYLFTGDRLDELEAIALTLAKTLNCERPVFGKSENDQSLLASAATKSVAIDCCDRCRTCQKIEHGNHADVFWVRPESKLRWIRIRQITRRKDSPPRVMLEFVNLKPTESAWKIGIIVAADRMNEEAANAFLKTLEEPPANSILVLLSTEPQRLLETILSRCLRLNFAGGGLRATEPGQLEWLRSFSETAAAPHKSLLARYRLLDVILRKLNELRAKIDESLTLRSPLEQYQDAEPDLKEQWEDELKAAIEAEYRRQRADLLLGLQWWLRDVWLSKVQSAKSTVHSPPPAGGSLSSQDLLSFPEIDGTQRVAERISTADATENLRLMEQLQRRLHTNVQEALALEVSLLQLRL
jgi:DNA polymerase-3 subunit delta'